MRHLYLACLLIILAASTRAQPTTVVQADSLRGLLLEAKADTNRVEVLLKLSNFYQRRTLDAKQNRDTALVLVKQAGELSKQLNYNIGKEEATFLEGKILIKGGKNGLVQNMLASVSEVNRIRLLVELGKQQLRPTSSQEPNSDSARLFFQEAEKLGERIHNRYWQQECQALIGVTYLVDNDWKQGETYFNKVIEARQRAGDKFGEMRALLRLCTTTMFCMGEECEEQKSNLYKALALCRQMGNKAWEVVTLLAIGGTYFGKEDFKKVEYFARQALAIQKNISYSDLNRVYHAMADESVYLPPSQYKDISTAYSLLSDIGRSTNNFDKMLYYTMQAIKDEESHGFKEALDYLYFGLGMIYFELEQFEKSIQYFEQSLAVSHYKGEVMVHTGIIRKIVQAMLEVGQARQALAVLQEVMQQNPPLNQLNRVSVAVSFGLCYQGLKQYQKAEQYFLEAVSLSEQANDYQYQVFAWYQISQFYVVTAQYKKAKAYVKRLPTTITTISQEPRDKLEFLLMHFKVDSALADYPSAIKHYQLYTALKDSIFNVTKSKQIEELGVRYDIEKKEQDLKLKEKNIALLRAQSKAQLNLRNALIGGTGLLLVLLAVIYNRFRLKRRSNQLLEAQQQALQARQEEINHKNTTLQQLLIEKERLLKEIHHRVKNNLQVVMSLLDSQADSLKDKAALSAIQESQHRVQAMALIHQKLYQSESVAHIPMNSYIEEVVAYLNDSYSLYQPTRFDVEVEDIELDVTLAVPLGLIINEAITNAFKYAFPHERSGRITVHLKRLAEASYELVIADDGVGLPASYDPSRSRSLGMTLIHGFSRQLGGKLTITSPPGMCISLMFQEENLSPVQNQTSYVYSS